MTWIEGLTAFGIVFGVVVWLHQIFSKQKWKTIENKSGIVLDSNKTVSWDIVWRDKNINNTSNDVLINRGYTTFKWWVSLEYIIYYKDGKYYWIVPMWGLKTSLLDSENEALQSLLSMKH